MTGDEIREVVKATLSDLLTANADGLTPAGGIGVDASCRGGILPSAVHGNTSDIISNGRQDASPTDCIPLEVSARHVHLTQVALEQLFGAGAVLGQRRMLSQPGEFLSDRRVKIITPGGELDGVAVLGPVRGAVQVELSASDCRRMGLDAPVKLSGDLSGGLDVTLQGTAGTYEAKGAAIIARNHIHCTPADANRLGLADGQRVSVRANTARPLIFEDVPVRVREDFKLAMHVDTDEANACALTGNSQCTIHNAQFCEREAAGNFDDKKDCPPVITDKVITEARAKELARQRGDCIEIPKGCVLTPSAKDVFLHAHIRVERT